MYSHIGYSRKVIRQRLRRQQQQQTMRRMLSPIDSQSDNSMQFDEQLTAATTSTTTSSFSQLHEPIDYQADEHDNINIGINDFPDESPPLFSGSSITTAAATNRIMKFSLYANLDKLKSKKLLQLIKSLLPSPNHLLTSHKQILKQCGRTTMFTAQHYCVHCSDIASSLKLGGKMCSSINCIGSQRTLQTHELTEVVTVNIRSRLESILSCNIEVLTGKTNHLFPSGDISRFKYYRLNTMNKENDNVISLILHADGAPLIRSTKQSLWPCYASIIELPPPIREYKSNILTLALWASRKKPDPDIFLDFMMHQLRALIERGTSIFIDHIEYRFLIRIQCFIADLPAKALLLKTINFNGRNACTYCLSPGQYNNNLRTMLYPYTLNNYQTRNHDDFVRAAKRVATDAKTNGKQVFINGIKGYSPLLDILHYPFSIIYDYMHLICIGHVPTLIRRWRQSENKADLALVDKKLEELHLPHNCSIKFKHNLTTTSILTARILIKMPLANVDDWKAKHGRIFVLQVGIPVLVDAIRPLYLAHFSIYSVAIILLHSPKNTDEIELADKLLHYYCLNASRVYDESIELYSLHSHLHLASQVRLHGGLCFHSAFAFESCIRYTQKRAHGTRNLASQISYWHEMEAIFNDQRTTIRKPMCIDELQLNNKHMDAFRHPLLTLLQKQFPSFIDSVKLYKRYKTEFLTYHSMIYDMFYNCNSYTVSYRQSNNDTSIMYGNIVCYLEMSNKIFVFLQSYESANNLTMASCLQLPSDINTLFIKKLNEIFSMQVLTEDNSYIVAKKSQLPAPDKSGLVKMRFQKQMMVGMIIRDGSREECDRSGRGLELAIRTDAESETEFTLSTQNKVEPHNGDSNSSSTAKLVKPTTTNSSALSSISELVDRNDKTFDAQKSNIEKEIILDVQDMSSISNVPMVSSDSDDFDIIDAMLDELQQTNQSKKQICRKKRKKSSEVNPAAKRLIPTSNILSDDNPTTAKSTTNEICTILKRIENTCQANKIQLEQLVVEQKRVSNIMRLMFDNQKRIQKSFAKVQIHVPLIDLPCEGDEANDNSISDPFRKSLEWRVGTSGPVDVLLLPSDPTNKTRYATKVLNIVFPREDLENIEPHQITADERYLFVKEAVRSKFKLDAAQMSLQWPIFHEAIMQKRRNNRRDNRESAKQSST
ncbi:unnamed protein product [Rotaria magnacalcarata]